MASTFQSPGAAATKALRDVLVQQADRRRQELLDGVAFESEARRRAREEAEARRQSILDAVQAADHMASIVGPDTDLQPDQANTLRAGGYNVAGTRRAPTVAEQAAADASARTQADKAADREFRDEQARQAAAERAANAEADRQFRADQAQQNRDLQRTIASQKAANAGRGLDYESIADGIEAGITPPNINTRSQYGMHVQAILSKRGYNLSQAQTDWAATQRHISTLNGPQQLRLNQAVNALPEMLDNVDALAQKWNAGRFAVLNRANLAAAKSGAYGREAAAVANQLDAQIADVVSDLGTVYQGGNSPTDHALALAQHSLSSDWDANVLHSMVNLAKQNVTIRRNSIANTGVAGASPNNPYAAPAPPAAAPAAPRVRRFNPATGQLEN